MRWKEDGLRRIAETDNLYIALFREDGKTCGTPTWIWPVVMDDGLDVRPYNGYESRWSRRAPEGGADHRTQSTCAASGVG